MRVVTYNVHGCEGRDGRISTARIADIIHALEPDVVALQEVYAGGTTNQLEALAARLHMQAVAGKTLVRRGGSYGNGLLTRLPIQRSRSIDLSVLGREPRGAIEAELEVAGGSVRVYVTHFGLHPVERRRQVKRLLRIVGSCEGNVVLAGDINEWLTLGRPLRWLHRHFGYSRAVGSFPSWWPVMALDRIWVHPPRALCRLEAVRTVHTHIASDHLPVVATVELP